MGGELRRMKTQQPYKLARHIGSVLAHPLSNGISMQASRYTFGNNAGLEQNLTGQWELWRAKRDKQHGITPKDAESAATYWKNGFVQVPGHYEPKRFSRLQERARALIDATPLDDGSYIIPVVDARLQKEMPEIYDLVDDRILSLVEAIYRSPVELYSALIWRTQPVPPEELARTEPYSNHWHNDSGKVSNVALFVTLTDIAPVHGPMHFVTRRRTRELMRMGYWHRNDYGIQEKILEDEAHISLFTGAPGTALLLSPSLCLHRAGTPQPGYTRDMARIDFFPKKERG